MRTLMLVMAQYGTAIVPIELVARDYFGITVDRLLRKVMSGQIKIPIVRMGASQKAAARP